MAMLGLAAPTAAFAEAGGPEVPRVVCGTDGATGLAVSAGSAGECGVALRVAGAYTKAGMREGGAVTVVQADGSVWRCQEQQGDPNPYQECVDTTDMARHVTLTS
ncbi:hypothetical protein ACIG54_12935 [Streptomyces achromogenes]|uniref:Secreted protein n=1 Tax=Streptomyces achromogenes TaxID=67255 RepID=A0ABZ1KI90_STRAH|nr:hypothetical protein [Streptomyces achromogenes]MCZ0204206.1 hypothetical protein [Streptomyces sp. UMAF16]